VPISSALYGPWWAAVSDRGTADARGPFKYRRVPTSRRGTRGGYRNARRARNALRFFFFLFPPRFSRPFLRSSTAPVYNVRSRIRTCARHRAQHLAPVSACRRRRRIKKTTTSPRFVVTLYGIHACDLAGGLSYRARRFVGFPLPNSTPRTKSARGLSDASRPKPPVARKTPSSRGHGRFTSYRGSSSVPFAGPKFHKTRVFSCSTNIRFRNNRQRTSGSYRIFFTGKNLTANSSPAESAEKFPLVVSYSQLMAGGFIGR